MTLRLNGATSGFTEIDSPAIGGSNTLLLPGSNGSAYQFLRNGATAGTTEFAAAITSGTVVASTSGTSIDFTSIPSYVKRITVMFANCSRSGSSHPLIQLGDAGGFETTGYLGSGSQIGTASASTSAFTSGFGVNLGGSGTIVYHGTVSVFLIDSNTWACSGVTGRSDATSTGATAGSKTLSDTLTQIRITHVNGTDTFDAGSINILYEG